MSGWDSVQTTKKSWGMLLAFKLRVTPWSEGAVVTGTQGVSDSYFWIVETQYEQNYAVWFYFDSKSIYVQRSL